MKQRLNKHVFLCLGPIKPIPVSIKASHTETTTTKFGNTCLV